MFKYLLTLLLLIGLFNPTIVNPSVYNPNVFFSEGINPNDIYKIDPRLRKVVDFISNFCTDNEVKFVITSMIRSAERNKQVKSVSTTHVEGRAVDFSVRERWGWNEAKLLILTEEVQMRYSFIGAYSSLGKQRTILLLHDASNGYHAHLQVDRNNPYKNLKVEVK